MKTCNVVRVLVSLVLVAGFHSSLAAQDFRGSISGTVKDESGGVLPGASVTVTNTGTNVATSADDQRPRVLSGALPDLGDVFGGSQS